MSFIKNEDKYNVNNYSDNELFDLLDLTSPTDRVLEAKIIQMINKYSIIHNESGEKLTKFFKDIYDHFFYDEDDEEEYEDDDEKIEGFENNTSNNNSQEQSSQQQFQQQQQPQQPQQQTQSTAVTQLDYKRDTLNPLLKQTIKRIISIDSQFRTNDTKIKSISTNFTFNLSEPLRDVVALRLYSIQIPYTWYTINNNFGGNFFYLKGNIAGIDNGDFDYKIEIPSGNYSPTELVTTITSSINTIKNINTDISFGATSLTYNPYTSLATFNINLQNIFNETNYQLEFPEWSSPNNSTTRYESTLAAFLGYNKTQYIPNKIYSYRTFPYIENAIQNDTLNVQFTLDNSNNYFDIIQYIGPSEYTIDASVNTIRVHLNLPSGRYTRNQIYTQLNIDLSNNIYLSNSYIARYDITDSTVVNFGNSYYEMCIQFNKKLIKNDIQNLKTVVLFPSETGSSNKIWATDLSNNTVGCFRFQSTQNEINNIIAETNSLQTNYIINSSPYFVYKCIASGFEKRDSSGNIYNGNYSDITNITQNDIVIRIQNSSSVGYNLNEYLTAINNQIYIVNNVTIADQSNENSEGVFNLTTMGVFINANTNNRIQFRSDITKTFTTKYYKIDFTVNSSGGYLFNTLKLGDIVFDKNGSVDGKNISLLNNNIFSSKIPNPPSSFIFNTPYILKIYPNLDLSYSTIKNAQPWLISTPSSLLNKPLNLNAFVGEINTALHSFQDVSGSFPLLATNLSMNFNSDGSLTSTLNVQIRKTLTQLDYQLNFYDPSANNYWDTSTQNSWYNNLKMQDQSYNLVNYVDNTTSYTDIYGYETLSGYTYFMTIPKYFILKAISNGVATTQTITYNNGYTNITVGVNDIVINIPLKPNTSTTVYTRQELFDIINSAFANNAITYGSQIKTYKTIDNLEYINIRLNMNKIYTTKDYRIVFYDPFSFVKCNFGVSGVSNATWDSTLGWILGFRAQTEYDLSDYLVSTNVSTLIGDTTVTTNLYNYFLIILDDYTQSHLNDGLVTLLPQETENSSKKYSTGPFIQDMFGLIPIKTSGLQNGQPYIEFGGTLQNQERVYFGPVNIHRMTIKLVNDKGDVVDLNGSNWSFSFVCEQLYQQTSI